MPEEQELKAPQGSVNTPSPTPSAPGAPAAGEGAAANGAANPEDNTELTKRLEKQGRQIAQFKSLAEQAKAEAAQKDDELRKAIERMEALEKRYFETAASDEEREAWQSQRRSAEQERITRTVRKAEMAEAILHEDDAKFQKVLRSAYDKGRYLTSDEIDAWREMYAEASQAEGDASAGEVKDPPAVSGPRSVGTPQPTIDDRIAEAKKKGAAGAAELLMLLNQKAAMEAGLRR